MEITNRRQLGHAVLLPVGHNHRDDLVVDRGDGFLRIQCKTGRLRDGVIRFSTASVRCNMTGAYRRPYGEEIDAFAVSPPTRPAPSRTGARGSAGERITARH